MGTLETIAGRITRRDSARSEATLQADIRSFILEAQLNLHDNQVVDVDMESQVGDGTRRRIDIEAGTTVIEVKKDLSRGTVLADAEEQLSGYLHQRVRETGARYLGVLTDGHEWHLYVPAPDNQGVVAAGKPLITTSAKDTERLRYWLATIFATVEHIAPTAEAIIRELGSDSPAHMADHATLHSLYAVGSSIPEVRLKRELWAKLLRTAFGSSFNDDQELFVDHTLLVLVGEIIAHAVVGFNISPVGGHAPEALVSGAIFQESQIYGVVESDFFDWVVEVEGGKEFVRSLASRLSKFDWSHPEHDALKHLYEAVISQETRKSLGEYYTPDWLAEAMIEDVDKTPLESTVADVACGSGTFIFHAVRAFLEAADAEEVPNGKALAQLTSHVLGMDVHPVAVTLARVTYLLAIGSERLTAPDRGPLRVPVFLGDSIQWESHRDLFAGDDVISVSTSGDELISGGGGGTLFDDNLVFPRSVAVDAGKFDALISDMANAALDETGKQDKTLIDPILKRAKITDQESCDMLTKTFATWRSLNKTGRDHIWGYYVRNLVRPLWMSQPENRATVLVGNPPWLRYSKMTADMQRRYRDMALGHNLKAGPRVITSQDLSTLFVIRALELYAGPDAKFAFVMPQGVLTGTHHTGFRTGSWNIQSKAVFDLSWDLTKSSGATGFPMTSCVIRGHLSDTGPVGMSNNVEEWKAHTSKTDLSWEQLRHKLSRNNESIEARSDTSHLATSPYKKIFRNGATIYPRMLFFVSREEAGPLGVGAGRTRVHSQRSSTEKNPWKSLPNLSGAMEQSFIHPVHLGETILPYRTLAPREAIIPVSLLDISSLAGIDEIADHPALSKWWGEAERLWEGNRSKSDKKSLLQQADYSGKITSQLPLTQPLRVVYSKAGNTLAAAIVRERPAIIDHKLYWAPVRTLSEGHYLTGILNSSVLMERVKPLQSQGLFGGRDFDKHIFSIAFPAFDETNSDHRALAEASSRAEQVAAGVDTGAVGFQKARGLIRAALKEDGIAETIDQVVDRILPQV